MKSQILHTVWCCISGEAAGEIWHWSLFGVKGLKAKSARVRHYVVSQYNGFTLWYVGCIFAAVHSHMKNQYTSTKTDFNNLLTKSRARRISNAAEEKLEGLRFPWRHQSHEHPSKRANWAERSFLCTGDHLPHHRLLLQRRANVDGHQYRQVRYSASPRSETQKGCPFHPQVQKVHSPNRNV